MGLPQTSVSLRPAVAVPGMLGDMGPWDVESAIAEETIPPGYAVVTGTLSGGGSVITRGTAILGVKLPAGGSIATLRGVAVYQAMKDNGASFLAKETLDVVKKGRVWVATATALAVDAAVYVTNATAGFGLFRNDNTNATLLGSCKVIIAASGAGVALIDFNLP